MSEALVRQTQFTGGINRFNDNTKIGANEYSLLVNGRVRTGNIIPLTLPHEIGGLPAGGLFQGLFSADEYIIVFVSGLAYYKRSADNTFSIVTGFSMNPLVEEYFVCLVPASTVNYLRKPTLIDPAVPATGVIVNAPVFLSTAITSSPQCLLVQDGVSQPQVIFADGTSRVTQNYDEWIKDSAPEYVPVMRQMIYVGGILYGVGRDNTTGKWNVILRSITGRPLDFMINIDHEGEKGGDAYTVSYRADYNETTCLSDVGAEGGGFFLSTIKTSYIVIPDYESLFFGEPTFKKQFLFSTGCLNNSSIVELLGDSALIDITGIRSFNAIKQVRIEGRNAPFSAKITDLFINPSNDETIIQDTTAAINFDNYGVFAVNTIYGYGLMWFDTMANQFVSLDLYSNVESPIRQFTVVRTSREYSLYFITTDNKLFKAFGSANQASIGFYFGEIAPNLEQKEQKPTSVNFVFSDIVTSGTVFAKCYLDRQMELALEQSITAPANLSIGTLPIQLPFGNTSNNDEIKNVTFDFSSVQYGWKVGFYITWDFNAKLVSITYKYDERIVDNAAKQTADEFVELCNLINQS